MAPLALEQVAEDLSNKRDLATDNNKRPQTRYYACQARAGMAAFASGFLGFSGGFAIQTMAKRAFPSFVNRNFVIPCLLGALVSTRFYEHLQQTCRESHLIHKELILNTDGENQPDHQVALSLPPITMVT